MIDDLMPDIATNPLLRSLKGRMRVTEGLRGNAVWVREPDPATGEVERFATPLLLALVSMWKALGQPASVSLT